MLGHSDGAGLTRQHEVDHTDKIGNKSALPGRSRE